MTIPASPAASARRRRMRPGLIIVALLMAAVGVTLLVQGIRRGGTPMLCTGLFLLAEAAAMGVASAMPITPTRAVPDAGGVLITRAASARDQRAARWAWTLMAGAGALWLVITPWLMEPSSARVPLGVLGALLGLPCAAGAVAVWLPNRGDGSLHLGPAGVDQHLGRRHISLGWAQVAAADQMLGTIRPQVLGLDPGTLRGMLGTIAMDSAVQASLADAEAAARVSAVLGLR